MRIGHPRHSSRWRPAARSGRPCAAAALLSLPSAASSDATHRPRRRLQRGPSLAADSDSDTCWRRLGPGPELGVGRNRSGLAAVGRRRRRYQLRL